MGVSRFSISADADLLDKFDAFIAETGYPTRSEAFQALMRDALVRREWSEDAEVVGALSIVYDHHRRSLVGKLIAIQHRFEKLVVCVQHVHVDHDNCLEVLIVKGRASEIRKLVKVLKSLKGLKHDGLVMTTLGHHNSSSLRLTARRSAESSGRRSKA